RTTHAIAWLSGDAGIRRGGAARPPLLARRQKARDSLGDGVGPVQWEEVPTGIDDLNRTFAKLLVEGFGPARLEEGIVGSPEDQRRRLDLVDVLRPAGEISVVLCTRHDAVVAVST